MAIRFQCSACRQPIEVDDEWASRLVACPYCRKTITAPAESTLAGTTVPVASPLGTDVTNGTGGARTLPVSGGYPNRLAVVALALAILTFVVVYAASTVAGAHGLELQAIQERTEELKEGGASHFSAAQKATAEYMQQHSGQPPSWVVWTSALMMAAGAVWLAAVICGVIAVTRPYRRSLAVAALCVTGVAPVFVCCASVLGV